MNLKTKIGLITALPLFLIGGAVLSIYLLLRSIILHFLGFIGTLDALLYLSKKAQKEIKMRQFVASLSKNDKKTFES